MNSFFTTILTVIFLFSSPRLFATEVSFTIDDPGVQSIITMNHIQVGEKIIHHFKHHKLKTILFICGMRVDSDEGKKLLSHWDQENHILANHTFSHKNYNNKDMDYLSFSADINKNEKLIQGFKNFKKFFRYPMLKEGDTVQKRDQLRNYLKNHNYSLGHVTIDASDWYISARFVEKINQGIKINFEAYKKYYLDHIWDRAQYYNDLSKKILGREIKHNILLHHNPLNAYFLGDLIQMFKDKGWKVINAEEAFKDPAYSISPKNLPAGESLLWGLAKESGKYDSILRYPAEDGSYQKDEMNRLNL